MRSIKQHSEYFHFRCKIQLDLPVLLGDHPGEVDPRLVEAVLGRLLDVAPEAVAVHADLADEGPLESVQVTFRIPTGKVATDTNILDLRTRHRTKLGWFFWF